MRKLTDITRFGQWGLLIFFATIISFAGAGDVLAAKMGKYPKIEVAFDAPDSSVELVGYLSLPPKERQRFDKPPLVILLHESFESSAAWETFHDELLQTGFAVFAMDFRGHGLSTFDLKMQKVRAKNTYFAGEQLNFPDDLAFLLRKTIDNHHDKFDTTRFAIVGADIGGSAGLIYAQGDPRVKYVAIVSPGMEYYGLRICPVLREYGDRPVLLAYSKADVYSRESVNLISDLVPRVLDVLELDDMFHGNRLVNRNVPLRIRLLDDLKKNLPELDEAKGK